MAQGHTRTSADARIVLRKALDIPVVTLPNLALAVVGWAMAAFGTWCVFQATQGMLGVLAGFAGVAINTLAVYCLYTVVHEATHGSVSRIGWLNNALGRVSALSMHASLPAFRFAHLEHHRYPNHHEKDPDHRSMRSLLVLRWLTQDFSYYAFLWKNRARMSRAERIEIVGVGFATLVFMCFLIATGHGLALLLAWVIPARIAIALLGCVFSWLPHRGHDPADPFNSYTNTVAMESKVFTVALIGQTLHNIHHLYPRVPFHRYHLVWAVMREELIAKGTRVVG